MDTFDEAACGGLGAWPEVEVGVVHVCDEQAEDSFV